jgi:flagellar hook protein FlgE
MEPAATMTISAQFNIDARSLVPAKAPFSSTDSSSYNYSNSTTIFDSLGNSHELSEFFVKTGTNKWDVYATSDGKPLATGGAFAPAATFPPHAPVAGSGGTPVGSVGFDSAGKMVVQAPTATQVTDAAAAAAALAALAATKPTAVAAVVAAKGVLDLTPEGIAALAAATMAETAAAAATAAPTNPTLALAATKAAADSATATSVAAATPAGIAYASALATATTSAAGVVYASAVARAATTAAAASPSTDTLNFAGLTFPNGSTAMIFNMGLTGTTQFSADNEVREMIPDGYASGSLSTLSVGEDGILTGKYSNQQSKVLGQIVLSSFANTNGLQDKGNNVWIETAESGAPLTGTPGSGKTMGRLLGGATEASNVDLTSELINLIIAQRTYQANTQTVKTQDQVVQALINLR